jgi:hypothetical protein
VSQPEPSPNSHLTKAVIHRLAANNNPGELVQLLVNTSTALVVHFDVALEAWDELIEDTVAAGCPCDTCKTIILDAKNNIGHFAPMRQRLLIAADVLLELEWGFPPALPERIEERLEELYRQIPEPEQEDDGQEEEA